MQASVTIAVSVASLLLFGVPQRSSAQVSTLTIANAQAKCPSWDSASDRIRASLMAGIKKTVQGWSSEPFDRTLICKGYAEEDDTFLSELAVRQSCPGSKSEADEDTTRITIRRAEVARGRKQYSCP